MPASIFRRWANPRAIAEFDTAFRDETDKITALAQNYYQTGTTMAEAYITQGREAGNVRRKPLAAALTSVHWRSLTSWKPWPDKSMSARQNPRQPTAATVQRLARHPVIGLSVFLALTLLLGGIWLYCQVFGMLGWRAGPAPCAWPSALPRAI